MNREELAARVLYRDDDLLVLNKPAGLAVHPGRTTPDSLEEELHFLQFERRNAPLVSHRLDRDTSGCLALARHREALRRLNQLFANGEAKKVYWGVVRGSVTRAEGSIELPLAKISSAEAGWRMVVAPGGQSAGTDWTVLGRSETFTWLELRPRTGRTHQLRVHCAAMGWPMVGDPRYGDTGPEAPLHLHARVLTLPYAPDAPPVRAIAPPPAHMLAKLTACGFRQKLPTDIQSRL